MAKVSEKDIASIMKFIGERKCFPTVTRFQYTPVDMEYSLSMIETIGKYRNPKFRIDNENRFVYENIIRWLHGDPEMKCLSPDNRAIVAGNLNHGIYIAGNTGTGKSWCMDVISTYAQSRGMAIEIGGQKHALAWGGWRADVITGNFQLNGDYFDMAKRPILCIQDLGSEQSETMYMGNRVNVLRSILEYRGDRTDKLTLVTSNLPMQHKSFIEKYGDRVASRMREMCNYFELTGQDRRKL